MLVRYVHEFTCLPKTKISDCNIIFFFPFPGNQKPDECEMNSNFETNKSPVIMEVSDGFDKPQPPIKLQKVVQNDQTSMKGSEDSKDQTINTFYPIKVRRKYAAMLTFILFL